MCCFKPDLQLDIHLDGAPLNAPLEGGLGVLQQEAYFALSRVHPRRLEGSLQQRGLGE